MKAFEFQALLDSSHMLRVPIELAEQLPIDRDIRVIVLLPESTDESDWPKLAADRFLQGYAESDAIYDAIPEG